ncbi:MAG: aminoglycoside phosphotransferase family protein [Gemmatimonadetes bacterium]|nr:aminoglycoside phosphotransferase family protein [Gemmatimonadota bacterium]
MNQPSAPEAVSSYLARLASNGHAFAAGQHRILPMAGGFNNRIFEVDTGGGSYLLKVYPHDRVRRLEREYAVMRRLSTLEGVPVAVSADARAAGLNAPVLIYEKLPGSPVEPAGMNREDLDRLLGIVTRVHGIRNPGDPVLAQSAGPSRPEDCLRYMDETLRTLYASAAMNDPSFRRTVDRLLDLRRGLDRMDLRPALWADATPRLCHGDFRPANVIKADPDRVALIDWEHAGIMDPFYEVAGFFWHPESTDLEAGLREQAIADYCERITDPHAREKIEVYQAILPVQWCVRILTLIEGYGRQAVQPWNEPRPPEALWEDLERYIGLAGERLGAALRGPA